MKSYDLSPVGGEFLCPRREAAFQQERLPEIYRHLRLLFLLSIVLNSLFFVSDWRFHGQPHFYVAIPARAMVVLISIVCLFWLTRVQGFLATQRVMVVWQAVCAVSIAFLVSSHSDIALFVVIMLPSIYYLVVPTSFRWTLISGIGCSLLLLCGYVLPNLSSNTNLGLFLAMMILNSALILVVSRANRQGRLAWAAIQAERQARTELSESRRMFEDMFMAVPIPLMLTERQDGRVLKANDAAVSYFNIDPAAPPVMADFYTNPQERQEFVAALERDGYVTGFETAMRLADGSIRDVLLAGSAITYGDAEAVIAGLVDMTRRKAMERDLEQLATVDFLTGLSNRRHFFKLGNVEIDRTARYKHPLSLLMIDLDNFKRLNDTYGHDGGDRALRMFAELCRASLRQQDIAARLGGEEFALLLPDTDTAGAFHVAERLRAALEVMAFEDNPVGYMTVSIGIVTISAEAISLDQMLRRADKALYDAKNGGRNRVVVYDAAPKAFGVA